MAKMGAVRASKTQLRFSVNGAVAIRGAEPIYFATFAEASSFAIVSSAATHRPITIDVHCPTRAAAKSYAGNAGAVRFDAMVGRYGAAPRVFERFTLPPVEYSEEIR